MPLLPQARISEIHKTAIKLGLAANRDTLVSGLPHESTAKLPHGNDPSAHVLSDLNTLNQGPPDPFKIWLQNAIALRGDRTESEVFERALQDVNESSANPTPNATSKGGEEQEQARDPRMRMALIALVAVGAVAPLAVWAFTHSEPPAPVNPAPTASVPSTTPAPAASSAPAPAPSAPMTSASTTPSAPGSTAAFTPGTVSTADPKNACKPGSISMENGPKNKSLCGTPPAKKTSQQGDKLWWEAPGKRDIQWMCSCVSL